MMACNQDVRFGCSVCGVQWGEPCPRTPDEFKPAPGWLVAQLAELTKARLIVLQQKGTIAVMSDEFVAIAECADAAEAANASEVCAAINELRSQRDLARFEAARARGEARICELALRGLKRDARVPPTTHSQGCICPAGAEASCRGALCPRRPIDPRGH